MVLSSCIQRKNKSPGNVRVFLVTQRVVVSVKTWKIGNKKVLLSKT